MSDHVATTHRPEVDAILARFVHPSPSKGQENMGQVNHARHYRGNGTETHARQLRAMLGEEGYAHLHFDTWACTGQIALYIPRYRKPDSPEASGPLEAVHLWALGAIDTRDPEAERIKPSLLDELSPANREMLLTLPGLECVDIRRVKIWRSGKTTRQVFEKVSQNLVYFRFTGGVGAALKAPKTIKEG